MPSRFLKDIDKGYIEGAAFKLPFGAPKQNDSFRTTFATPSASLRFARPSINRGTVGETTFTESTRQQTPRRLVSANTTGGATRVAQLSPGQFIEHERFGVGEVLKVEGTGENTKAHIRFKNAGEKQLLLKFARFRVLG